jgi:hypothetical protein
MFPGVLDALSHVSACAQNITITVLNMVIDEGVVIG